MVQFLPWYAKSNVLDYRILSIHKGRGVKETTICSNCPGNGLIPLTWKDIAWPHRRILQVSQRPNVFVANLEIIVRVLGLISDTQSSRDETILKLARSSRMAAWAWDQPRVVLQLHTAFLLSSRYTPNDPVLDVYIRYSLSHGI